MLQIIIEHSKDTVSIRKICDDGAILSEMQDDTINLDVCIPYINQDIIVHHNYLDNSKESYTLIANLEAVEINPPTNIKCIKYSPKNTLKK